MSVNLCNILDNCGLGGVDIMKILASCVMTDAEGNVGLNTIVESEDCNDLTPLLNCNTKDVDVEAILRQVFTCDSCGHLAIRIFSTT
jgi:hypothetical protein